MIRSLIIRFRLKLNPPKPGDIYYGEPFCFFFSSNFERILHGTRDKSGSARWVPIPSDGCYRLTIESDTMPYYRCASEVLCRSANGEKTEWLKRSQERRILKDKFHDMIVDGRLVKA